MFDVAVFPMNGVVMLASVEQFWNAPKPRLVTLSGIVNEVSLFSP